VLRGEKTYPEGIRQLARYMDSLDCSEGWLVVFDRRNDVDWEAKIFSREEQENGKIIHIIGC
jgi:hypothetical protein